MLISAWMPIRAAVPTLELQPERLLAGLGPSARGSGARGPCQLELNFVYRGALQYFAGGRFVELTPGSLSVFWAAWPHRLIKLEAHTEFMFARLPLTLALRWQLPAPFVRKLTAGEVVVDAQNACDAELTRRWVGDLLSEDASLRRTCELEVEARLRRLSVRRQHKTAARSGEPKARRQVEIMTRYLSANYRDDISTSDIGAAVKLHPNYAMTLFRRECGMSIWQYLIRLRLAHAQLMLLSSDETVLAIALESGFGSLARFYAAFTREAGISPGEFRKRAQP
jgi:AraC-like DNA-binding protein